uniref:Uncharacterized protein n=1 Tax=Microplitis mediator bracovirus TaxID=1836595 RepID=A0A2I6SGU3_9VIRU|nr:hypothetical protein MmBV_CLP2 [Microplitis mediator bracovirus]
MLLLTSICRIQNTYRFIFRDTRREVCSLSSLLRDAPHWKYNICLATTCHKQT